MERRYPCLFECRDGTVYLVLEDPLDYRDAQHVVLRLDGLTSGWVDVTRVYNTLTMEALDRMDCAWRDY